MKIKKMNNYLSLKKDLEMKMIWMMIFCFISILIWNNIQVYSIPKLDYDLLIIIFKMSQNSNHSDPDISSLP